jgi:hypothetical protein
VLLRCTGISHRTLLPMENGSSLKLSGKLNKKDVIGENTYITYVQNNFCWEIWRK